MVWYKDYHYIYTFYGLAGGPLGEWLATNDLNPRRANMKVRTKSGKIIGRFLIHDVAIKLTFLVQKGYRCISCLRAGQSLHIFGIEF